MGVFDDVKCLYPLPWPEAQGGWFQSKCTPAQYCETYEVRENGRLWYHKKERKWREDGHGALGGCFVEISSQWCPENVTGEIELHAFREFEGTNYEYTVKLWFRDGLVKDAVFDKRESGNQTTNAEPWGTQ